MYLTPVAFTIKILLAASLFLENLIKILKNLTPAGPEFNLIGPYHKGHDTLYNDEIT